MKLVELVLIFAFAIPVFAQQIVGEKLRKEALRTKNDASLFVEQNQKEIADRISTYHAVKFGKVKDVRAPSLVEGVFEGTEGKSKFQMVHVTFEYSTELNMICQADASVVINHSEGRNGLTSVTLECRNETFDGYAVLEHRQLAPLAIGRDIFLPSQR